MYSDHNTAECTVPLLEFYSDSGRASLCRPKDCSSKLEDSLLARDRAFWRTAVSEVSGSFLGTSFFSLVVPGDCSFISWLEPFICKSWSFVCYGCLLSFNREDRENSSAKVNAWGMHSLPVAC